MSSRGTAIMLDASSTSSSSASCPPSSVSSAVSEIPPPDGPRLFAWPANWTKPLSRPMPPRLGTCCKINHLTRTYMRARAHTHTHTHTHTRTNHILSVLELGNGVFSHASQVARALPRLFRTQQQAGSWRSWHSAGYLDVAKRRCYVQRRGPGGAPVTPAPLPLAPPPLFHTADVMKNLFCAFVRVCVRVYVRALARQHASTMVRERAHYLCMIVGR